MRQKINIKLNYRKLTIKKKHFLTGNHRDKIEEKNKWLNSSKNQRFSKSSNKKYRMKHLMMKKSPKLINNWHR